MNADRQFDAAIRHAEAKVVLPWTGATPDEAMMAREDAEIDGGAFGGVGGPFDRAALFERLLVFLFADGQPECWECTAVRGLSLMRHCAPSLLCERDLSQVEGIRARSNGKVKPSFRLTEFVQLEDDEAQGVLRVLLGYLFPEGPEWVKEGCRRIYLLARGYQPGLVQVTKQVSERVKVPDPERPGRTKLELRHFPRAQEMSYEDMARVFGENTEKARARWSARAQRVIRKPIEANGGTVQLVFGKSATAREKYRDKAKGNKNRKGERPEARDQKPEEQP